MKKQVLRKTMAFGGSYLLSSDQVSFSVFIIVNVQVPLGIAAKSCQYPVTNKNIVLTECFLPVKSAYAVTDQVMSQPCFCCDIH